MIADIILKYIRILRMACVRMDILMFQTHRKLLRMCLETIPQTEGAYIKQVPTPKNKSRHLFLIQTSKIQI